MVKYTLRDVYNIADRDLIDLMSVVFYPQQIPGWFYQPNAALNNETPADLCFEGRDSELRDRLIGQGKERLARKLQYEDNLN